MGSEHAFDLYRRSVMMTQAVQARFVVVMIALGIFSTGISIAQQPQHSEHWQFEVATIKPARPQAVGASTSYPNGQFRMTNMPLKQWVEMGLSVKDYALREPAWLDTARFDLVAKLPEELTSRKPGERRPGDEEALAKMMKALLIERFGLKWHEEPGTVSGYELVPDKKVLIEPVGLLERLKNPGDGTSSGPTLIGEKNMPLSELAKALEKVLGKPVVDATHLTGVYTFKLMWRPSDEAEVAMQKHMGIDVDNLPGSVSDALREKLGLRLQSAKVPSRVVVVDNINREPTPN
jgi:uncharacterized protein (TIGR03435 family)